MKRHLVKLSGLVAVGLMTAFAARAADAPTPAPAPGGTARPDRQGGPRGGGVALDDKQRELLREAMQKNRDEVQKLDEKFRSAQKELVQAAIAEKYDEKTVREKADAVSKIQSDLMVLRAKAFSSVAPTLKPEQREQIENSRMGPMMVLGGGFGGGMGGGPGGQGGPRRGGPGGPGGPGGQGQ